MMITIVFAIVAKQLLLLFYLTDFHGADKIEKKKFPRASLELPLMGERVYMDQPYVRTNLLVFYPHLPPHASI